MRRISLFVAGFFLACGSIFAQAVQDNVVIPVSVTLNSILRMNVTSGGNIEFIVNTMEQYQNGISESPRYTTTFTVASSLEFDVLLNAETDFIGSDDFSASNTLTIDNLGYIMEVGGTGIEGTNWDITSTATVSAVTLAQAPIIQSLGGLGAGDINQNKFLIKWRLGTMEGTMNTNTLISQSIPSDRYTTNVFLVLAPQ